MVPNLHKYIKTPQEIETMRVAGKILAEILQEIQNLIEPGSKTWMLETRFLELTKKYGVTPACKSYQPYDLPPFPTGLCVSINKQSVHCYPKRNSVLKKGDIVTVDTTIKYKGMHVDSAFAMGVGIISEERKKLLEAAESARDNAIKKIKPGIRTGTISHVIQKTVQRAGFDVLRDYAGHGIGKEMHEYPEIPCFGNKNQGPKLKEGMTICIEPLVCSGHFKIKHLNGWETEMDDGGDFCQFEHTVLVTKNSHEILTQVE
jgi:methionyl aminopeptidase